MPIAKTDQLFSLIKSLTKAEKRNFKIYANRTSSKEESKFITLFDTLDKLESYDEKQIKLKIQDLSTAQFTNIKRHLYTQILKSLRLIHNQKEIDIQIREQLDFAKILYGKGLYRQALKILDRVNDTARKSNQNLLLLEILEFEKMIESRHITRSRKVKNKVEGLIEESKLLTNTIKSSSELLNLSLKIHGLYIKFGYAKDEKDLFIVKDYFKSNLPDYDYEKLSFFEKVFLHQSYVWYYNTSLDFNNSFKHALKWVNLYHDQINMINEDVDSYMRGMHYLLTNLVYMDDLDQYNRYFDLYEGHIMNPKTKLNQSSKQLHFAYFSNATINKYFIANEFSEAVELIPSINRQLNKYLFNLDEHRIIVLNYKFAWMCFCAGQFSKALDYINKILNLEKDKLRLDIFCYTRLLEILCHLELKHFDFVNNSYSNVRRIFNKYDELNGVIEIVLAYILQVPFKNPVEKRNAAKKLHEKIKKVKKDPFQIRAFLYFNFEDWAYSQLEEKSIEACLK